jgi:DNA (cytosine-5)-methyltransferase 1
MPSTPFDFVDLFSGIGGFEIACKRLGGNCIAACDIDKVARDIYESNHGITPHDDIRTLKPIRNLDLVCGGFPCQSHSSLGKRLGMRDPRGKLFNDLVRFLQESQPKCFLFENVKGLLSSGDGKIFPKMLKSLRALGYIVTFDILDSQHFGLPQHRERVFIVGHRTAGFNFAPLLKRSRAPTYIKDVLDRGIPSPDLHCSVFDNTTILKVPMITATGFVLFAKLSNYTDRKLFGSDGILGTISTGSPPPIYDQRYGLVRHLSKNELKKCQGFPNTFKFPPDMSRSSVQHYIGNSVSVNVVQAIVAEMRRQGLF